MDDLSHPVVALADKKEEKKVARVPRNVFFMGLASFFNDISSEMVLSAFPAFFMSVLKSGAGALGFMEGLAEGLANFVKVFSGRLSDRTKKRKSLAIMGYAISALTRPFYPLAGSVLPVAGLRATDRIGKGLREPPRDALISLSVSQKELGHSFGYHRGMDAFGAIFGPLLAYFILSRWQNDFRVLFYTSFAIGILSLLSFVFVREVSKEKEAENSHADKRPAPKIVLAVFFVSALGTLPVALLLLKAKDLGFSMASIPLLYLVYSVSFIFFSFFVVGEADIFGDRKMISLGYALFVVAYICLMTDYFGVFLLGLVLFGAGSSIIDSVQRSYVARRTDAPSRGKVFGHLNASTGLGLVLGGATSGLLWENLGVIWALSFGAFFSVLGSVFFAVHYKKLLALLSIKS